MKYIAPVLSVALAAAAVSGLQHQVRSEDLNLPSFSKLDQDGSGTISEAEAEGYPLLQELFADVDENEDEQLTETEYSSAVRYLES